VRTVPALVAILAALVGGVWIGGHSSSLPGPIRDFAQDDDLAVVGAAIDEVRDGYYRDVPKRELSDDAIRGLVRGLDDRFSSYFDPKEYSRFRELTDARFSGVGTTVQRVDEGLRVMQVYDESPAEAAGLKEGDIIVAVDGRDISGRPEEASTGLIKGPAGTKVTLTIRRDDKTLKKTLTRREIRVDVVQSRIVQRGGEKYGVIHLDQFSSGAHAEIYAAVRRAKKQDVAGLALDLRANGGGLVEEARLIASAFLPDGKVVTTRGRSVRDHVYTATGDPVADELPMVVLVDEGTASASEIVAGALQDRDRAKLVGTKTFGKGVFQQVIELDNGGALDLTVGQYFLPSGRNIGGRGVERGAGLQPDVKAEDDPATPKRDEALDRALRLLAA
jgi:carboxyl-terminal processing protease